MNSIILNLSKWSKAENFRFIMSLIDEYIEVREALEDYNSE